MNEFSSFVVCNLAMNHRSGYDDDLIILETLDGRQYIKIQLILS